MTSSNKKEQQIFTLIVEVGRSGNDGLPNNCSGAALICYCSGIDEAEAVRETIITKMTIQKLITRILKTSQMRYKIFSIDHMVLFAISNVS